MNSHCNYRIKLAQGFLQELHDDIHLKRWRSAMDSAQLFNEDDARQALDLAEEAVALAQTIARQLTEGGGQ